MSVYKFKIDDQVRVIEEVPLINAPGVIPVGARGVIHNAVHSRLGMWAVRLVDEGCVVLFKENQLEHA